MIKKIYIAESVGKGHPDKICDQIADHILDKILEKDENAKVAVEILATNRLIIIGGEINTTGYVDVVQAAWDILTEIGYKENDFSIVSSINSQSPDITKGIEEKDTKKIKAGDQGFVFGYAVNETEELMPLGITLAHEIAKKAEELRKKGSFFNAKADLKTLVLLEYENKNVLYVKKIVFSIQHDKKINNNMSEFKKFIENNIVNFILKKYKLTKHKNYDLEINPIGSFNLGGPFADTGLTGRKIIVDTYGDRSRHGGGSFSGKDCSKVDRTGAYIARWIAKNVVAANLADEIEIKISYIIGKNKHTSLTFDTFGTEKIKKKLIDEAIKNVFDLSINEIINDFQLKKPLYTPLAVFGHFGRNDLNLPWEKINKVKQLQEYIKENQKK